MQELPVATLVEAQPMAQTSVTNVAVMVPAGISPGMQFPLQLQTGQVVVTCPAGAAAGQQIMVPVHTTAKPQTIQHAPQQVYMAAANPTLVVQGQVAQYGNGMTANQLTWSLMPCTVQGALVMSCIGVLISFIAFAEGIAAQVAGSLATILYIIYIPMFLCGLEPLRRQIRTRGIVPGNVGIRIGVIFMYVLGILDALALVVLGVVFDNWISKGWIAAIVFWNIANICLAIVEVGRTCGQYSSLFSTMTLLQGHV